MGHISPLISIIHSMKDEYKFLYFGLKDSMEEEICKRENIEFYPMKLHPFYRKNIFKNIKTVISIIKEKRRINKQFKNYNVKAIISSGGFVSIPLVLSKIKCVKILLESNTTLGLANKILLNFVDHLGAQFDTIHNKKAIVLGNPIIIREESFDHPFFYLKEKLILFVGGSNGAFDIVKIAYEFNIKYPYIKIFVITGNNYYDTYKFNENARVFKRITNLSSILYKFDLVVSRAGASTITELLISKVLFILIPSKNVSANHQELNAKYLKEKDLCEVINDVKDVKNVENIYNLLFDERRKKIILNNQYNFHLPNSIKEIKLLISKNAK